MVSFCSIEGCINVKSKYCPKGKGQLCNKHGGFCLFTTVNRKPSQLRVMDVCDKFIERPNAFCDKHRCKADGCRQSVYAHSRNQMDILKIKSSYVCKEYCINHCYDSRYGNCNISTCCLCKRNMVEGNNLILCPIYVCAIQGCNNAKLNGLKICETHKCPSCDNKVCEYGVKYCKKHACKIHPDHKAENNRMCQECILESKNEIIEISGTKYKPGKVPLLDSFDE
jgi:hypothetical protein